MAKKVVIVLLCILLLLVLILGAYSLLTDKKDVDDNLTQQTEATTIEDDEYLDEDMSSEEYITDDVDKDTKGDKSNKDSFVPSDEQLSDNTDDIVTTNFTISRVYDHTLNKDVSPRVVFGSGYNPNENYIIFDSSGKFEIYLSGYFNNKKTGTFTQYDDIIYVEYTDSTAAEYDIEYNESGVISYIIVNYGDYDIYFS